jgi:Mlc titration factor MtfA (ptsG expression regulator)
MLSKLTQWFGTRRRDRALRDYAIEDALWQATLDGLPFLAHLEAPDRVRL